MQVHVQLPEGTTQTINVPEGSTGLDLAKHLIPDRANQVLGVLVNREIWDATRPLPPDAHVRFLFWEDPEGKYIFWHSSAHLLAHALSRLVPDLRLGTGPPLQEGGFYYDVDTGNTEVNQQLIERIEQLMLELARQQIPIRRKEVPKQEAIRFYQQKGDPYKLELLAEIPDETVTMYEQADFIDLCRGPHLPHTGYIRAVKILNVSQVYWRGDASRPRLTRIYGITFPSEEELHQFLKRREEARQRDHRTLGKQLRLFAFSQRVGSGLPLWLPRGAAIRRELEEFLYREQVQRGYQFVYTPHIARKHLYEVSGHFQKYWHHMFQPFTSPDKDEEYLLRPMNCPHHCEVYRSEPRSYRSLPLRIAEFGTVYRYEQSGELSGLLRVRGFTVDDAHIFCTPEQIEDEFMNVIDLVQFVLNKLGFREFRVQISVRDPEHPEKYIGTPEMWERAENQIRRAVEQMKISASELPGEAAFYGPKLDFVIEDALGRTWQLGTIQLDYNLPERFDLTYMGPDNQLHRPVMIHRAPFGSLERFTGILIEHTAGRFPFWLAPIQVAILPISDKYLDYAHHIATQLRQHMFRVWIDDRDEKISKKIRDAEVEKIPVLLIVGAREAANHTASVRLRGRKDLGAYPLDQIQAWLHHLRTTQTLELEPPSTSPTQSVPATST